MVTQWNFHVGYCSNFISQFIASKAFEAWLRWSTTVNHVDSEVNLPRRPGKTLYGD